MNRGIARRTVFESREDIRFFLSRIARARRRRELEVHAFAVLSTHFHLLARSPGGRLSAAMMRIEHEYVRWFNRRRRRDGALFRGRFLSRRVSSERYWRALLRYIDDNAVVARLADRAVDYPWCSAWHYARVRGPRWLDRGEVETAVVRALDLPAYSPASYDAFVTTANGEESRWLVERRLGGARVPKEDALDHLVSASPGAVVDWMRRKARLADGTRPNEVLATAEQVSDALARCVASLGSAVQAGRDRPRLRTDLSVSSWIEVCRVGLLRDVAGLRIREIEARVGRPRATVARWIDEHRRRICLDERYAELAGAAAQRAIRQFTVDQGSVRARV